MFNHRVNRVLGRVYGLQGLPTEQLPYFLGIFVVLFPIFLIDPFLYFFATIAIFLGWLSITKNDPQKQIEKLYGPRRWRSAQPDLKYTKAGLPKADLPKQAYFIHKGKKMYWAEKNYETFLTFFEYAYEDDISPGAYVHQRGTEAMFIFGWRCYAHDPSVTEAIAKTTLYGVLEGLKAIPFNVDLKVIESSFVDDSGYRQHQDKLASKPKLTFIERALIAARLKKVQDMTSPDSRQRAAFGHMQSKELHVYAKFRVQFGASSFAQPTAIDQFFSALASMVGVGVREPNVSQWEKAAKVAYETCFEPINSILSSPINFGFDIEPLSKDALWEIDYTDCHQNSDVPLVPQYVVVTRDGISFPVINDPTHILGKLYDPELGFSPNIQSQRSYVYVPTLNKYVGFVKVGGLDKIEAFPSVGESKELGLYRFWHNVLTGNGKPFCDYKIVLEYTRDYSGLEKINADRTVKGSVQQQATAIQRKSLDVTAQMIHTEAVEAREMLEQNNPPGWISLVIAVYRDSVDELATAMAELVRRMPTTNSEIATEVCEHMWYQMAPYTWSALQTQPQHRRRKYFATETVPQIPFVTAPGLDKSGIMFLHSQLRSPIYIDVRNKRPNNIAIGAETGAGKSVVTFDLILEIMCYSDPAIVFEFPRPDGRSTYTEFVEILKLLGKRVVYLDIRRNKLNVLQKPNTSHLDRNNPADREKLEAANLDIEDGQVDLIATLVLGTNPLPETEEDTKDWIRRSYRAFNADPQVKADYEAATQAKFGTPEHLRMPNLTRYANFAREWLSTQLENNPTIYEGSRRAIDKIVNRLLGVLESPLGRSLDGPSTFDMDVDFIVLSLTDVAADLDSLVYSMYGLQLITQKAVGVSHSTSFFEECTTLYQMRPFARKASSLPPTARKLGMNTVFVFQSIQPIFDSGYGHQLFNNIQNILLGSPTEGLVKEFVENLGFRKEMADSYIGKVKNANKLETYWYAKRGNKHLPVTHTPPKLLVFLAATDTEEVLARNRCRAMYGNPDDPSDLTWLIKGSELYYEAIRKGQEMSTICPQKEAICI